MRTIPRNGYALAARMRRGGFHDDRRERRGGTSNDARDWLTEYDDEVGTDPPDGELAAAGDGGDVGSRAELLRRRVARNAAVGRSPDDPAKRYAGMTLDAWLRRAIAVPNWAADAVARHPAMLLSPRISVRHLVRLHAAAPPVVGRTMGRPLPAIRERKTNAG